MSKKNKRGRPKQKVFLNPTAYAFSRRRQTQPMTAAEITAVVEHLSDYDPDGSRGIAACDAVLDAISEAERRICYEDCEDVARPIFNDIKKRLAAKLAAI